MIQLKDREPLRSGDDGALGQTCPCSPSTTCPPLKARLRRRRRRPPRTWWRKLRALDAASRARPSAAKPAQTVVPGRLCPRGPGWALAMWSSIPRPCRACSSTKRYHARVSASAAHRPGKDLRLRLRRPGELAGEEPRPAGQDDPQGLLGDRAPSRTPSWPMGVEHLRPLNLKTVADAIGMHESTVSRVTSNNTWPRPAASSR